MITVGVEPILHKGLIYDFDWKKHRAGYDCRCLFRDGRRHDTVTPGFPELRTIIDHKPEVIEPKDKVRLLYRLKGISESHEGKVIVFAGIFYSR